MDPIIDSYLSGIISEEVLKQWLQGSTTAETGIASVASSTPSASTFADLFIDNLHRSFDWLTKQTQNVPRHRVPPTAKITKISLAEDITKNLNINDHESFPSLEEASKPSTPQNKILTKRIKPTLVSQSRTPLGENNTFQNVNYGRNNNGAPTSDSYKVERELLKNVRERRTGVFPNSSQTLSADSSAKLKPTDVKRLTVIEPKYEAVSDRKAIVKLKTLYVHLLMNNHVTSLVDEIKFILEIINKRTTTECSDETLEAGSPQVFNRIFSSYHNCFYFVYLAFEGIFIDNQLINLIDSKAKVQLSNSSLLDFHKDASPNLKELIERTYLGRKDDDSQSRSASENNFVYFQPDTDSKSNFPNDHSFSIFRKQRDDFYKLMKKYHDNGWNTTLSTDSKAQSSFTSLVSSMLSMSRDVGNCYHLARLFVSQLLKSCTGQPNAKKSTSKSSSLANKSASLSYNEEKYNKLQDRFVRRPRNENHLSPNLLEESFSEKERFFSDFIYYSDSHSFNEQLKLILKSQMIDLTSTDICNLVEIITNSIDEDGDTSLLVYLGRINLLAKFLGFLCFYPLSTSLSSDKCTPDKSEFLLQQTHLRTLSDKGQPILDIESYLVTTMKNHFLVVAVPWVVEFLLFIDPITLAMSYYDNVLGLLCLIYKYYLPNLSLLTFEHNSTVSYTRLFMQLFLEKLFAIKKFNAAARLQSLTERTDNPAEVRREMFNKVKHPNELVNLKKIHLDFRNDIFDFELISAFFSQFSRLIENLFKQAANEVRKITPTCVTNKHLPVVRNNAFATLDTMNANSVIQLQAEECFLNISSKSLRNCIKFINERITATCIKRIKSDTYPKAKTKHFEPFLRDNAEYAKEATAIDLTAKLAQSIRAECKAFVPEYASTKVKIIFPQVIDDDLDESVGNFAIRICLRNIKQKCNSWIELNITNETVSTDLVAFTRGQVNGSVVASRAAAAAGPESTGTAADVSAVYQNFEKLVYDLRELLYSVNMREQSSQQLETSRIIQVLSRVKAARRAPYLPSSNAQLFDQTTLDLALSIVCFSPQLMTDELLDSFFHLWTSERVTYQRVICLKTLHMLTLSESTISTWLKFEFLLTRMLKANVVSFADIAQTADSVLKESWPQSVLSKYASLLNAVVACAKQHKLFIDDNSSHQIVEWLSWFCAEKDIDLPTD